jgi:putative ABC transport system permease protein
MSTVLLAIRNLLRNGRRSLATLLAITIAVVTVIVFGGYGQGIVYGLQTGYVQSSGHLQVQYENYFKLGSGNPSAYGIPRYGDIITAIQGDPQLAPLVRVVTPILITGGVAGNYRLGASQTVMITGLVVPDQNRMREWDDYGFRAPYRPLAFTNTDTDAALVGTGVARILKLCGELEVPDCVEEGSRPAKTGEPLPADIAALAQADREAEAPQPRNGRATIDLLAVTARGAPNVAAVHVVAAENQGVKQLDDVYVAVHLAQAQRLVYGAQDSRVTAIAIQLHHTSQLHQAELRLNELLASRFNDLPLRVLDYRTLNPFYDESLAMFATIFTFISALIACIVLFTVGNTMGTAVVERTTEIGTLRAIGLRRSGIRRLFICEGAILGIAGTALGVIVSIVIAMLINNSGITWRPPGWSRDVPLFVRIGGDTALIAAVVIAMLAVVTMSAWWPARRAARLNIVDALRHV